MTDGQEVVSTRRTPTVRRTRSLGGAVGQFQPAPPPLPRSDVAGGPIRALGERGAIRTRCQSGPSRKMLGSESIVASLLRRATWSIGKSVVSSSSWAVSRPLAPQTGDRATVSSVSVALPAPTPLDPPARPGRRSDRRVWRPRGRSSRALVPGCGRYCAANPRPPIHVRSLRVQPDSDAGRCGGAGRAGRLRTV